MVVKKVVESIFILDTEEDVEDFIEYMNDPGAITQEGSDLIAAGKKIAREHSLDEL